MTRVRRAAGSRVRGGREGLHRGPAPARGRHRLLRRRHDDGAGQQVVDDGAVALDRGRAVLRQEGRQRLSTDTRRLSCRCRALRKEGAVFLCRPAKSATSCSRGVLARLPPRFPREAAAGLPRLPRAPAHRPADSRRRPRAGRRRVFFALWPDAEASCTSRVRGFVGRRSRPAQPRDGVLAVAPAAACARAAERRAGRRSRWPSTVLGGAARDGVAWLEATSPPAALTALHEALARRSARRGIRARGARVPAARDARAPLHPPRGPGARSRRLSWAADRLALVVSTPAPGGSRYETTPVAAGRADRRRDRLDIAPFGARRPGSVTFARA